MKTDAQILDEAFNAAIASIQDAIGQADGGFAGVYFTSSEGEQTIKAILAAYLAAERKGA